MSRRPLLPLFFLLLGMFSSISAMGALEESTPEAAASAEATGADLLEAADTAFHQAALKRNRSAMGDLLADDAVFLADVVHRGKSAFLGGWSPVWEGKYDFTIEGHTLETHVADSGELGFTVGSAKTSFTRPGLEKESIDGHYLSAWALDDEGQWKLVAFVSLVVHAELGQAREPRSGLMTAWPQLADRVGSEIDLQWKPETTRRAESDDMAHTFGSYEASFVDGEEKVAGGGHFFAVWQKDEKGRWQLAAEGFTPPGIHSGE